MTKAFKAILLDLDGTFVDTALDFIEVVNTLRSELGLSPLPAQTVRQKVSLGANALTALATDLTETEPSFDAHKERLLKLYDQINGQYAAPFAGMSQLIDACGKANIPWGIVTNKPMRFAEPLLNALNLSNPAATLICPDHVSQTKPHPESLLVAAKNIGVAPEACIYVGDHERDILAGKAAGMFTLTALYGYIDAAETPEHWGHDAALYSSEEIIEHAKQLLFSTNS